MQEMLGGGYAAARLQRGMSIFLVAVILTIIDTQSLKRA